MPKLLTKSVWIAKDGKEFEKESDAIAHENKEKDSFQNFLTTYSGNRLLEKYTLDTEGVWEVYGEDDNPDLGGRHYQPKLGVYQGKLENVIRAAVILPNFWTWGGGGDIRKVETPMPIKV